MLLQLDDTSNDPSTPSREHPNIPHWSDQYANIFLIKHTFDKSSNEKSSLSSKKQCFLIFFSNFIIMWEMFEYLLFGILVCLYTDRVMQGYLLAGVAWNIAVIYRGMV